MTSKLRDFLCHLASAWHEYKVCFSSSHCHESVSFLRTVAAFWNPGFLGCVLAKHLAQARSSHLYGVGIGHAPLLLCVLAPPTWPFLPPPLWSFSWFPPSWMGSLPFLWFLIKGVLSPGISSGFVSWLPVSPQTAGSLGHNSSLFFSGPWEHLSIVPYIMGMKQTFRK